jgi:arsenate reductase
MGAEQKPVVLFSCIHNSGRSVAAKLLMQYHAKGKVVALSRGTQPADKINPVVSEVLRKRGLDTTSERPTKLDLNAIRSADYVVTMGCGENCEFVPGKKYLDWEIEDPYDKTREQVELIVSKIEEKVIELLEQISSQDKFVNGT